MGGAQSSYFNTITESWTNPDVVPKISDKPKHDSLYGFKSEREERG